MVSVQSPPLISDIEREVIALPDLQRPFVWEDTKVRDLLDSLLVGFPVGTLVFWHTSDEKDARALGAKRPGCLYANRAVHGFKSDFVLTLLSVYHGELREKLEERARAMSIGASVGLDTQQLLRAVCGVAFGRARMLAVYRFLRGVDPVTGDADPERRLTLLSELDDAADDSVELTPWRDYLLRIKHAGFVSQGLIASRNAIVNAYSTPMRCASLTSVLDSVACSLMSICSPSARAPSSRSARTAAALKRRISCGRASLIRSAPP